MKIIDHEGFTNIGKEYILRTASIFQHFEVSQDSLDWKWLRIDGSVFGSDMTNFMFYLYRISFGFSVQLVSKNDTSHTCYMFGIHFFQADGQKEAHVYHHSHGPFTLFGVKY